MAQWLKLDTGILSDEKIQLIRELPEGDSLFTLWIALLCIGMKKESDRLYIATDLPYSETSLAKLLHIKPETVKLGVQTFEKLGMVERLDDGALVIVNLSKHQELSKLQRRRELTAKRVARYREIQESDVVERENAEKARIAEIVEYFNSRAGTSCKPDARETVAAIVARLDEGFEVDDFKKATVWCVTEWAENERMQGNLHPRTVFGSKMESYVEAFARGARLLEHGAGSGGRNGETV